MLIKLSFCLLCFTTIISTQTPPCPRGQIRRCRNNILPACENWFLPHVRYVSEDCIFGCECIDEDYVYSYQLRKCVPTYKCRTILEDVACTPEDPNGEQSPCLPSKCDEDGVCTRDCKRYCVCKEGYMFNKFNRKCLKVPTPL